MMEIDSFRLKRNVDNIKIYLSILIAPKQHLFKSQNSPMVGVLFHVTPT